MKKFLILVILVILQYVQIVLQAKNRYCRDKEVNFAVEEEMNIKRLVQVIYANVLDGIDRKELKRLVKDAFLF